MLGRRSFAALCLTLSLLVTQGLWARPEVVNLIPYIGPGQTVEIGRPLGIAVIFSEDIYGFDKNDVISNGKVLAVDGENRHYRIVVEPVDDILTLDILRDSAFSVNGEPNDPIRGGPFRFDLDTQTILSVHGFRRSLYGYPTAYRFGGGDLQVFPRGRSPSRQDVRQQGAQGTSSDLPTPLSEITGTQVDFLMHAGIYAGGALFLNRIGQTNALPGIGQEIWLGFETITPLRSNRNLGMGFYALTGYHRTPYDSISNAAAGTPPSEGLYTAIPLEMGMGLHVGQFMSMNLGILTHFSGEYEQNRLINTRTSPPSAITLPNGRFEAKVANGAIGLGVSVTFKRGKLGLTLRYQNIQLEDFSSHSLQNQPSIPNLETVNYISNLGIFFTVRS